MTSKQEVREQLQLVVQMAIDAISQLDSNVEIDDSSMQLAINATTQLTKLKNVNDPLQVQVKNALLRRSVYDLGFSKTVQKSFKVGEIFTVRDLTHATVTDLLQLPTIGRKSLEQIQTFLRENGLSLAN